MALLSDSFKEKLIFLTFATAFLVIGNVAASFPSSTVDIDIRGEEINKTTHLNANRIENQQKTFKKQLKVNPRENLEPVTITTEIDNHTNKIAIVNENSIIEIGGKAVEQKQLPVAQKGTEKSSLPMATSSIQTLSPTETAKGQRHDVEEYLSKGDDDVSDSLKTGFYFFLILSSGAVIFITYKIYRLRLSRAERRYGVQGNRTTQELTPLPVSIEDFHSEDEDQTIFEVQRQNIRIF